MKVKNGFTLVELLIVIGIVGTLIVGSIGFFTNSLKGTRDSRRKADLNTLQKALESYYNDNGLYPATIGAADLCLTQVNCYLKTIPTDPKGYIYLYVRGGSTGSSYQLYSTLESNIDSGSGNDDTGIGTGSSYSGNCGVAGAGCKYGVSSTNATP